MNYALRPETAAAFAGKVVILTGSAGFLGKHFNTALHDADAAQVICMDPADSGLDATKPDDWESRDWHERPTADFVIHAAGIASPFHYHAKPLQALDAALSVRNALEYCKANGSRLLFLSSSEIYGDPPASQVPTQESYRGNVACRGSRACYDESKRLGETLCQIYHDHFGVESVTVRPFNFIGPGMKPEDYRVLPNWREAIRKGEPLRIYGNGNQTRTFCHVSDGIRGCLEALAHGVSGDVYNVGNPKPEISMLELAARIGKVTGKPVDFVRIDHPDTYPADEPQRRCPDIRKAREHFGFEPMVALDDALAEFFAE